MSAESRFQILRGSAVLVAIAARSTERWINPAETARDITTRDINQPQCKEHPHEPPPHLSHLHHYLADARERYFGGHDLVAAVSGKKDMKPDLPIIGQNSPTNQGLNTLLSQLMWAEAGKVLENQKAFEDHLKIHELRKSCGLEDSEKATINIRRPPRYRYLDKP